MIRSWIKMLNKFISGVIFLELVGGTQNILKMALNLFNLFLKNFSLWKSMINFKRFDELILSGKKTWKWFFVVFFLLSKMTGYYYGNPTLLKSLSPPSRNWFSSRFLLDLLCFFLFHGFKRHCHVIRKLP